MATFNRRKAPKKLRRFPRIPRAMPLAPGEPNTLRRRGVFLLPNLFTTAALFSGFFAIVQAMNHRFDVAGWAIIVAMGLDGLDGRVARLTNTQSDFGAEYDSLSDMVAFGIAPALVMYQWALLGLGKWGWLGAFVYVSGAALRLARFNTNIDIVDKRFFQGLPSPAAAATVTGFVWLMDDLQIAGTDLPWLSWAITLYAGLSMVSNSPFYSGKAINLKKSVPFFVALVIVLVLVLVATNPPVVFCGLFALYGLSGHGLWLVRRLRGRKAHVADGPAS